MNREELIKFLKENLKLTGYYDDVDNSICIGLFLDGECICETDSIFIK